MRTKVINGVTFTKEYGHTWRIAKEAPSSRLNSWITLEQIGKEYPEFIDKIADILYYPEYNKQAKDFARSMLTWLELWKFVSWKQFDSIFTICKTYDEYKKAIKDGTRTFRYGNVISFKRAKVACTVRHIDNIPPLNTDRAFDRFHQHIFGHPPLFEEEIEEGMVRDYRPDGSRYFRFPTDADMTDALMDLMNY